MSKKLYFYIVAIILGLNYNALASISESDKAVFKKHDKLLKAQSKINFEASKIFSNYTQQLNKYISALKALKSGKSSKIDDAVKNLERKKRYDDSSLKSCERSLQRLNKKIASIKIDKAKQLEVDEMYSKINKMQAKINELRRPYIQRKKNYMAKIGVDAEKAKIKALITPLMKLIPGTVSKFKLYVYYESFKVSCFFDKKNKRLAHANIGISPITNRIQKEKLAGIYPIYYVFKNNIYFNVGDFQISFQVHDKSLQGKAKVKELAQKLINLPNLKKASSQKTIQKWLAASKFIQKIDKESAAVTGKLHSQRFKLVLKMNKMSRAGFKPSAEIKRLNAAYLHAKLNSENYKETISIAKFLLKQLKVPVNNRKIAIQAIEKKIENFRNELFSYCAAIKKQKASLVRDINFPKTNEQYQILVRKFVRLPQSENFALVNRKVVDAWLGNPQIKYRWEQDFSSSQSPSRRIIFVGRISYCPDYILSNNKAIMVDNKYPIIDNSHSLVIRVGDFNVSIYSAASNIYDHNIYIKTIKEFYDLDAIANITK